MTSGERDEVWVSGSDGGEASCGEGLGPTAPLAGYGGFPAAPC